MAVAKYTFKQSDPFESSKSINSSIFSEFQRRKLYGEQDGDKFSKKLISYKSFGGDVVITARGKFTQNQPTLSWRKPSHSGKVKKIAYNYTDPITGSVSKAIISKINLKIDQIVSGDVDDFAELMFAGNDKIKIKGLLGKQKSPKTGFDMLDKQALNRGMVIHPFKSYTGDDLISVSGNLRVNVYGGEGSDRFENVMTKKASIFPQISVFDAEAGESMKLKGLKGGWDQYGGSETAWSIYKKNDVTNSGSIASIIGAKISEFDIS